MTTLSENDERIEWWELVRATLTARHHAMVLKRELPEAMTKYGVPHDGQWLPAIHTAKQKTSEKHIWIVEFINKKASNEDGKKIVEIHSQRLQRAFQFLLEQGDRFAELFYLSGSELTDKWILKLRSDAEKPVQKSGTTAAAVFATITSLSVADKSFPDDGFLLSVNAFNYTKIGRDLGMGSVVMLRWALNQVSIHGPASTRALNTLGNFGRLLRLGRYGGTWFDIGVVACDAAQLIQAIRAYNDVGIAQKATAITLDGISLGLGAIGLFTEGVLGSIAITLMVPLFFLSWGISSLVDNIMRIVHESLQTASYLCTIGYAYEKAGYEMKTLDFLKGGVTTNIKVMVPHFAPVNTLNFLNNTVMFGDTLIPLNSKDKEGAMKDWRELWRTDKGETVGHTMKIQEVADVVILPTYGNSTCNYRPRNFLLPFIGFRDDWQLKKMDQICKASGEQFRFHGWHSAIAYLSQRYRNTEVLVLLNKHSRHLCMPQTYPENFRDMGINSNDRWMGKWTMRYYLMGAGGTYSLTVNAGASVTLEELGEDDGIENNGSTWTLNSTVKIKCDEHNNHPYNEAITDIQRESFTFGGVHIEVLDPRTKVFVRHQDGKVWAVERTTKTLRLVVLDRQWFEENGGPDLMWKSLTAAIPEGNGPVHLEGLILPGLSSIKDAVLKGIYDEKLNQMLITDGNEYFIMSKVHSFRAESAWSVNQLDLHTNSDIDSGMRTIAGRGARKVNNVALLGTYGDGCLLVSTTDNLHFLVSEDKSNVSLISAGPNFLKSWEHKDDPWYEIAVWMTWLSQIETKGKRNYEIGSVVYVYSDDNMGNYLFHYPTHNLTNDTHLAKFYSEDIADFGSQFNIAQLEFIGDSWAQHAIYVFHRDEGKMVLMRAGATPNEGNGWQRGYWIGIDDFIRDRDVLALSITDPNALSSSAGNNTHPNRFRPIPPTEIDNLTTIILRFCAPFKTRNDGRDQPHRYEFDMPWGRKNTSLVRLVLETPKEEPPEDLLDNSGVFKLRVNLRDDCLRSDDYVSSASRRLIKAKRLDDGLVELTCDDYQKCIIIGNYPSKNASKYRWELAISEDDAIYVDDILN